MSTQDQEAPDVNEEPATLPVDPKETEKAGKKLAQALGSQSISVVVCWDKAEDAVLAHVVARELGVPVCYAYESGGIMGLESRLPAGASTALVADVLGVVAEALVVHDNGSFRRLLIFVDEGRTADL